MALRQKPVKGQIIGEYFYPYARKGTLSKSRVSKWSRSYASTEEESIEWYNEKVNNQIQTLQRLLDSCKEDLIQEGINE